MSLQVSVGPRPRTVVLLIVVALGLLFSAAAAAATRPAAPAGVTEAVEVGPYRWGPRPPHGESVPADV